MVGRKIWSVISLIIVCAVIIAGCTPASPEVEAPAQEETQTAEQAETSEDEAEAEEEAEPTEESEPMGPQHGGTLNMAFNRELRSTDPQMGGTIDAVDYMMMIAEPLVVMGDKGLDPWVLEDWEADSDGTYTWKVRQGIEFTDGTPLDAEAVLFSIERLRNPENEMHYGVYFDRVTNIEVVDDYTLELQTDGYDVEFMERMINIGVVSPNAVKELGDDFENNPVGSGPFVLVSRRPGERIELESNPDYWRPDEPYLDKVVIRIIPEESVRLIELQAETLDFTIDMAAADLDTAKEAGLQMMETGATQQMNLYFNLERITDVDVRKAVNYAIDREALVTSVYKDIPKVACYSLPSSVWAYEGVSEVAPCYEYDLDKANALLDEAGWKMGDDGIRVNDEGEKLIWNMTADSIPSRLQAAELIAGMLKEIGIQANLDVMDHAAFVDTVLAGGHDIAYWEWLTSSNDPWSYAKDLHSEYSWSTTQYSNPMIDDLIDRGKTTVDREERQEIYNEYFKFVQENSLLVPIAHKPYIFVARPEVSGVRIVGNRVMFHETWLDQ